MKKTKILAAGFLCTVLGLAGCGSQAQEPAESQASETSDTSGESGIVEISFWHSISGDLASKLDEMTENFNNTIGKEKGIKVNTVFQDWPGTDKLVTVMQAGDLENHPDVIQIYGENVNIVRDYDRMVYVEDFMAQEDSQVKKEDILPNAANAFSVNGKMMGAPLTLSTLMLYYNKDMFDAAGIENPPATIAEMAEDIELLTKKNDDGTVSVHGLNVRPDSYELNSWIGGQGEISYFGNNENGRSGPMTEVMIGSDKTLDRFLTEWQKVIETGGLKSTIDNMNEEFARQQHAMVIMSSARIQIMKNLIGDQFNWGVANLPKVSASDKGGASVSGGGLFMIDKGDPEKLEATWEFVQYCLSPETQLFWAENTGYIPVNQKTYELPEMQEFLKNAVELNTAVEQVKASDPRLQEPYYPNAGEIKTVVKEAMMRFADGTLAKEQTEEEILSGCEKAIADYYRSNPLE